MGALDEMWKQVDALVAKERAGWPRWIVWETETDISDTAEIVQSPTEEAAREKYLAGRPSARDAVHGITARRATTAELKAWDDMLAMFPHPTADDLKRMGER